MANPPFSGPQHSAYQQAASNLAAQRPPDPFLGGKQPLAPKKIPPSLLSVDKPPEAPWELLVSDNPDYYTPYLIAQRWPSIKAIVSVDNPPFSDPDRTAAFQSILKAWDQQAPQQQPRYKIITGPVTAAGVLNSLGTGTTTWIGSSTQSFLPKIIFQQHIIMAWDVPASIPQRRNYFPQVIAAAAPGNISSAGTGVATWTGTSVASGVLSSTGIGAASWIGSSAQNSAPRFVIQQQIIAAWTPQQLLLQPRRFVPQVPAAAGSGALSSLGVGLANWIGTESASAAFFGAGTGVARFVGRASAAHAARFDGWLPARVRAEERKRKDEKEIMDIAQAVLPLLQRGIRQATRIDL